MDAVRFPALIPHDLYCQALLIGGVSLFGDTYLGVQNFDSPIRMWYLLGAPGLSA